MDFDSILDKENRRVFVTSESQSQTNTKRVGQGPRKGWTREKNGSRVSHGCWMQVPRWARFDLKVASFEPLVIAGEIST